MVFSPIKKLKRWLKIKYPWLTFQHRKVRLAAQNMLLTARHMLWFPLHPRERKKVLVYCGAHLGASCRELSYKYKKSYIFDADPDMIAHLERVYKWCPNVRIVHAALADSDGTIDFHISNQDGGCSSIGRFRADFLDSAYHSKLLGEDLRMLRTIRVPSLDLGRFLEREGIDFIDDYVSDIQGMDLTVLHILRPFIESRRIARICCEVTKDHCLGLYELPDNSLSGFKRLLDANYRIEAQGSYYGGKFYPDGVMQEQWDMDYRWVLR